MKDNKSSLLAYEYQRLVGLANEQYCEIYHIKKELSTCIYEYHYREDFSDKIEYYSKELAIRRRILKDLEATIRIVKNIIKNYN